MSRTVIGGAIGNCVHVAGVSGFLRIAGELGYETVFLGAAVPVDEFVEAIRRFDPEIVGISYRLTAEVGERVLKELKDKLESAGLLNRRFAFGGTPPVCEAAEKLQWFERTFDGLENPGEVWSYLKGVDLTTDGSGFADTLVERMEQQHPYPLLRHHFGLPDLAATIDGIAQIAESRVLDVVSIAPDQNAQESFFRQNEMDPALDGAGGVPVRTAEDLKSLYKASCHGNHPLLRIYSGTRDVIKWAELATETINNAWAAIPLCWYSVLDGRSKRPLADAIRENQSGMHWYAERGIPVEVNEAHHWALRGAHDTVSVVAAYLAALNAKEQGVRHYVAQYMFNSPPTMTPAMDLAKILAQVELIEGLHDDSFCSYRQVRTGLLCLSPRMSVAKGQLAASMAVAMSLTPNIVHVVGFCEGDHAASADDVTESCEIVRGVVQSCMHGMPDVSADPAIQARKDQLVDEAELLLGAIDSIDGSANSRTNPETLARAIKLGLLDAPQLKGNPYSSSKLETRTVGGAVYAVDAESLVRSTESERLASIMGDRVSTG